MVDEKLSDLPEDTIEHILNVATVNAGVARLVESLAMVVLANLRSLVTLEHLGDSEVDFENDTPFAQIAVIKNVEVA